jgi:hypothetical protein
MINEILEIETESTILIQQSAQGIPGQKGDPGEGGALTVNVDASENIGGHRAVTSDGYYADSVLLKQAIGISQNAVVLGESIDIQNSGVMEELSWNWIPNSEVFLSELGVLTQDVIDKGLVQNIAVALTATKILIDLKQSIEVI